MPDESTGTNPTPPPPAPRRRQRFIPCRGYRLHVTYENSVWLNTEAGNYDGIEIGLGGSSEQAIDGAIETLLKCVSTLKRVKARG